MRKSIFKDKMRNEHVVFKYNTRINIIVFEKNHSIPLNQLKEKEREYKLS